MRDLFSNPEESNVNLKDAKKAGIIGAVAPPVMEGAFALAKKISKPVGEVLSSVIGDLVGKIGQNLITVGLLVGGLMVGKSMGIGAAAVGAEREVERQNESPCQNWLKSKVPLVPIKSSAASDPPTWTYSASNSLAQSTK